MASCSTASQTQSACRIWCACCAPLRCDTHVQSRRCSGFYTHWQCAVLPVLSYSSLHVRENPQQTHQEPRKRGEKLILPVPEEPPKTIMAVSSRDISGRQSWKICCVTCSRHACRPNYRFRLCSTVQCRTGESYMPPLHVVRFEYRWGSPTPDFPRILDGLASSRRRRTLHVVCAMYVDDENSIGGAKYTSNDLIRLNFETRKLNA